MNFFKREKDRYAEDGEPYYDLEFPLTDIKRISKTEFTYLSLKKNRILKGNYKSLFRKNGVQRYGVNFMFTDFTDRTRLPPNENFYKVSQNLNADKTEDNLTDQTEEKEAKKKRARWVYFENAGIPTDSLPKIENVVSSDNLKEKLDLENLAMKHKNA